MKNQKTLWKKAIDIVNNLKKNKSLLHRIHNKRPKNSSWNKYKFFDHKIK